MKNTQISFTLGLLTFAIGTAVGAPRDGGDRDNVGPAPAAAPTHQLSAAQLVEAQARVELANSIAQNVAADAQGKGVSSDWRIGLLSSLYNVSSSALRGMSGVHTLSDAHLRANEARAASQAPSHAKALGSTTDDLVFTPKTPCRFIDTRVVGGPISGVRTFDTFLTGPNYGGDVSCVLPVAGGYAFAANVTVVVASGSPGYLALRPAGSTAITSFINWPTGGTTGLANSGIITTALVSGHYQFEAVPGGNTPDMILDYFGYFAPNAPTALDVTNGVYETFNLAINYNGFHYTSAVCPSGYAPIASYCYNNVTDGVYLTGSGINSGAWCGWRNLSGAAVNVVQNVFCARVP